MLQSKCRVLVLGFGLSVFASSISLAQDPDIRCEGGEDLALYLDAPAVEGGTGALELVSEERLPVSVRLRSDIESGFGVQSYSLSVAHDSDVLEIASLTDRGTGAELATSGFAGGFRVLQEASSDGVNGFVYALVLTFTPGPTLPPVSDLSLVHVEYGARPGLVALGPGTESLEVTTRVAFHDNLRGEGQPVSNVLQARGTIVGFCTRDLNLDLTVLATRPFIRGDANIDSLVDVSDAVTILRSLFFDDTAMACADAADANDDGRVDVSDAVRTFDWLFLGGSAPLPPFPLRGQDPTSDSLGCEEQSDGSP